MALNVQMVVTNNKLIGEKIVSPRIVNMQTLSFDAFCDYMAQGSSITAADVSAVMKQLEKRLPLILSLNTKVVASPDGLAFRPTVKGSLTQSQLKEKLTLRKQNYLDNGDTAAAARIDVDRALEASDLTVGDLVPSITIDLPRKWDSRFAQSVEYKRVSKDSLVAEDSVQQFTINITSADENQGTVAGGGIFASGTQATIKATPKAGYQFDRWSDNDTNATRTFFVDSDLTLVATFKTASTNNSTGGDTHGSTGGGLGD